MPQGRVADSIADKGRDIFLTASKKPRRMAPRLEEFGNVSARQLRSAITVWRVNSP